VLVLEGGYNLQAIARSAEACVRALQGEPQMPLPPSHDPAYILESADEAILRTAAVHLPHWPSLRTVWGSSLDEYALQLEAQDDQGRSVGAAARAQSDSLGGGHFY
jgi:hypothetical protein